MRLYSEIGLQRGRTQNCVKKNLKFKESVFEFDLATFP